MTYSRWGLHTRTGRRLPFALLLAAFVITAGGHLAYSSVLPAPPRRALSSHNAAKPPPPRFLSASCAPQLAVTPVALETPTATAATPTPILSSVPILDQAQLLCTGGLSVRANPTQTFTVGLTGQLVRVDIPLCSPTKNVRIDLTLSTTDGSGQSSTASVKLPHDYSDCAWYEFDYSNPLAVTRGDVLQLQATPRNNHKSALWGYAGDSGADGVRVDPYPGGQGLWRGQRIDDFAFQTYVQ